MWPEYVYWLTTSPIVPKILMWKEEISAYHWRHYVGFQPADQELGSSLIPSQEHPPDFQGTILSWPAHGNVDWRPMSVCQVN